LALREPVANLSDPDFQVFSGFGSRDEDYETLNSGYSITPLADFGDRNIILLPHFNRLSSKTEAATATSTAATTATIVSASVPRYSSAPPV
jgi:hypothetical protein